MMSSQRAVIMSAGHVALERFDPPLPQAGQVLLRALTTLISPGTERAFFLNLDNTDASYPLCPGYSFVGVIEACGAEVIGLRAGDRVVCPAPHASRALVDARACLRVPAELPDESAAFFNLLAIAMQGARKARIELGESVAILGAGIVGILAMRLAQLSGGLPVIGIDLDLQRLDLARRVGADNTLVSGSALARDLQEILGAAGANVVIEATGAPSEVTTAFRLAAEKGRVVLLGSARGDTEGVNFYRDVHRKGLRIIGGHEITRPRHENSPGYWTQGSEHRVCLDLLARRRVDVTPLITHRYNWRDFPRAYAHLAAWDKDALGILIEWT
ncbi:MAG: zinc-binding alcohol dehydrogenase [Chloroflexi bacterium]|nr:zinc-binding alcohol dehydrogenase [Chloroflexota bacterium]